MMAGATSRSRAAASIGRPATGATGRVRCSTRGRAPHDERLGAESIANRAQPAAVCFRVRQAPVVARSERGPAEGVDSDIVVAPVAHHAAGQVEQPLLYLGMRPVERVDRTSPR